MAFGFPARFSARRTYQFPQDELAAAVKSALENLGWSYQVLSDVEFLASVPFGGGTWGEDFKVKILPGGVVEAESKCITVRAPQVFDFGKNRKNIETFFALVEHCIRQGVDPSHASATKQELVGQVRRATPINRWAGNLFGGCLIVIIILIPLTYFICAVIGLLTGYLYLPSRGAGGATIHGAWARIISVIILAVFTWIVLWVLRERKKRRQ